MFCLAVVGCTRSVRVPDLGGIYGRAAQLDGPNRNPVIVIPGILGSRLVDSQTGQVVWGAFSGDYANPEKPQGARLLALPMRKGAGLAELTDTVVPERALDRLTVGVFGLPVTLDAYANILATLGAGGYRDQQLAEAGAIDYGEDHFTCFQFAYDWRRDNIENAKRLHDFILQKKTYVEAEYRRRYNNPAPEVRFDLVAHSMGGLIARYYLRYGDADLPPDGSVPRVTWAGASLVDRVILIGTPNAGSIDALTKLTGGVRFAPVLPKVQPAVLGTMPAIYQLLPRARHQPVVDHHTEKPLTDLYDPAVWQRYGWGLANPEQQPTIQTLLPNQPEPGACTQTAADHLHKCLTRASRFAEALDQPSPPPPHLSLYLFAGDAVDTPSRARVDLTTGNLWVDRRAPGDGTVLRSSAPHGRAARRPLVPPPAHPDRLAAGVLPLRRPSGHHQRPHLQRHRALPAAGSP